MKKHTAVRVEITTTAVNKLALTKVIRSLLGISISGAHYLATGMVAGGLSAFSFYFPTRVSALRNIVKCGVEFAHGVKVYIEVLGPDGECDLIDAESKQFERLCKRWTRGRSKLSH